MTMNFPRELKFYFVPEYGDVSITRNTKTYDAKVQHLNDGRIVLWYTHQTRKRLWGDRRLLDIALVLMPDNNNKEE